MPEFSIAFEVYCASCNAGLCNQSSTSRTRTRGELCVRVDPCEACMDAARERGESDGYDKGFSKGYDEGLYDGANK